MDTVNHHSTGPKTPEGKACSSQNARKSGWFSQDLRVAENQQLAYAEFDAAWREELAPESLAENELFADFLRAAWHKREIVAAQNELTASAAGAAAFLNDAIARQLHRLHRYERDFERRAARHLAALRRLQAERAPAATPAGLSGETARQLYIMERETKHINAMLRACKAGILLPDTLRQSPRAA